MELRQLRAFLQVANDRHFGQAAAALKITQPALTQRIQALERELGVQLLTRSAREVRLTPAGEVLLPYADSLVHIEDRALRDLTDNAAGRAGRLRVSYQLHGDSALMSEILATFRARYPKVEVQTGSSYSVTNAEQIVAGQLDAAFVAIPVPHQDVLATKWIRDDEVFIAVSEANPLARLERVPVTALAGQPMILYPTTLSPIITTSLRRWLEDHVGAALNVVAEEPWEQATLMVARSNELVGFGRYRLAEANGSPVVLRSMTPAPLTGFGVAYRRDDDSTQTANLLKVVDEVAKRLPSRTPSDGELITAR